MYGSNTVNRGPSKTELEAMAYREIKSIEMSQNRLSSINLSIQRMEQQEIQSSLMNAGSNTPPSAGDATEGVDNKTE